MCNPFIRNHQYNVIRKQAEFVQQTLRTVADRKVLQSVRENAEARVLELFPDLPDEHKALLSPISKLETAEQFHKYLESLEPHLSEFPQITGKQIQKLFPKNKKLKLPDLAAVDYRHTTYLSWTDISTGKLFIVYHSDGEFVGLEGRFTPTSKRSYCFLCSNYEELALFSVKTRAAGSSPDDYKAHGQYVCLDHQACNRNVTDTAALEKFIRTVKA